MSYAVAIGAMECLNGRKAVHFAKMGLAHTEFIMAHKKDYSAEEANLKDISLLEDLINRSRGGDAQAMEAIYERFNRPLFSLIYRYTANREVAEDLLQDVFLKIFSKLESLRKTETFVSWMYRIAVNTCFGYLRGSKSRIQRTVPLNNMKERIGGDAAEPSDRLMKKSLDDAIHSLPNRMKTIFLLHDVQGFKHEEIAPMLGCSVGTSKSQLFKARMKIRERLERGKVI
ncbi:MAG: sigma-70 family RNA polymerase sigma factor [Candidatus Aminicenantes bacterium]|nr:MAG: sigma-70 family RNA polymerase sigma factor [Candidatus Aminicenantes bacterium]